MKGRVNSWVGDSDRFDLDTRIFHAICLMLVAVGIASIIFNIAIGLSLALVLLTSVIAVGPLILFYVSRFLNHYILAKVLFIILSYVLTISFWFFNGGINGIIILLFVPLLIWQMIFTKRHYFLWFLMNILALGSMLLINYYYPASILGDYRSESDRFFDHAFTYIAVSAVTYIIIHFLLQNYKQERSHVNRKNNELEKVNSELDKINIELVRNISELENVNRTKNKLFSVVSHDIRSFAGNIQNFSYLLLEHKSELSEENELLYKKQIYKASKNLEDLLNNLLSWAHIQMHSVSINPVRCNVKSVVKINYGLYKIPFEGKRIKVEVNIPKEHEVIADSEMMSCIVRNIISNALKFTPEDGNIRISSVINDSTGMVELAIADSGVGMPQRRIEQIYTSNTICSERGTNNEKGSGMGLILVKEYIEANKGHLLIESTKGKGTIMTVALPLAK